MTLLELLLLLFIAGVCGGLAQSLTGFSSGGCLASIALGFIGALLGRYLSQLVGLPELLMLRLGEQQFPVVWSIVGAAIFVSVLGLLSGRRRVTSA